MSFDYQTLDRLRQSHPSWRLLRADQAPLVASFFHRVFILPNIRVMAQSALAEALEDELFALRERLGNDAFPKSALEYLNDWAANDKAWLRKFYRQGSDEPYFDLMHGTEKAIAWLTSLTERSFVGTESRLLTLFELLKQITQGTETDAQLRIIELQKRREEIDREIVSLGSGDFTVLDDTAVRDRFQQFVSIARELLSDFREVEHNFVGLDRKVRERIASREGSKGSLLEEIMGERDEIADSDQGKSFRAFWDFLMSSKRQEELSELLQKVLTMPAVSSLKPDLRLQRVHYDWLEAGEHTQRTVAQLSQQLRRFLDDAAWLENRRIMDILQNIESQALELRGQFPEAEIMSIEVPSAEIDLPMERALFSPPLKPKITSIALEADDSDIDTSALFARIVVDPAAISRYIRQSLQERTQISLSELVANRPLSHGLEELIIYMQLATDTFEAVIDEKVSDSVSWSGEDGNLRTASLPRVIYVR